MDLVTFFLIFFNYVCFTHEMILFNPPNGPIPTTCTKKGVGYCTIHQPY